MKQRNFLLIVSVMIFLIGACVGFVGAYLWGSRAFELQAQLNKAEQTLDAMKLAQAEAEIAVLTERVKLYRTMIEQQGSLKQP